MTVTGAAVDGNGNLAASNMGLGLTIACGGALANTLQPQITANNSLTGNAGTDGFPPDVCVAPILLGGISSRTLFRFDASGNCQWTADHSTRNDQGQVVGIAVDKNQYAFAIGNRVKI
jgi:hypothetical protein